MQQLSANLGQGKSNVYTMEKPGSLPLNRSGLRNLSLNKIDVKNGNGYPMTTKTKDGAASLRQVAGHSTLETNLHAAAGAEIVVGRRTESQPASSIPGQTTRSTKMSGQKLRKLPGHTRTVEVENMPSDISDDEWGEIQKFGQKLHEEKLKKEKAQHVQRVKQVRDVLDQQVKLRAELREKQIKEKVDFDRRILEQARKDMEIES